MRATSPSFAFTSTLAGPEPREGWSRARKHNLQTDLTALTWLTGAPSTLFGMLRDCFSENGYATTYDEVIVHIRDSCGAQ